MRFTRDCRNRLIFAANRAPHPKVLDVLFQLLRVPTENRVVAKFCAAESVNDHAIDASQFHLQQMVIQHLRITGIAAAGQWIEL